MTLVEENGTLVGENGTVAGENGTVAGEYGTLTGENRTLALISLGIRVVRMGSCFQVYLSLLVCTQDGEQQFPVTALQAGVAQLLHQVLRRDLACLQT